MLCTHWFSPQFSCVPQTTKNTLSELEKREKRAMERKISELEEELKVNICISYFQCFRLDWAPGEIFSLLSWPIPFQLSTPKTTNIYKISLFRFSSMKTKFINLYPRIICHVSCNYQKQVEITRHLFYKHNRTNFLYQLNQNHYFLVCINLFIGT